MDSQGKQPAILQYEGPDSIFDQITEEHFRDAIDYMVKIFPPERDFPDAAAYDAALLPYDFDYRCAKRTLERYAIEVLGCDVEAMRVCYRQYSEDPSFYKDGLPRNFVRCVLDKAWADIAKTVFVKIFPPSDEGHRRR